MRWHLAALLGFVSIEGNWLSACECIEIPQRDAFKGALVIFRGKVKEIEHMTLLEALDPRTGKLEARPPLQDDHTIVTFDVDAGWKGPVTPIMKVHATVKGSVCPGYTFQEGKRYVVYAVDFPNPNWDKLRRLAKEAAVYDIPDCPLRVRTDVEGESKLLGKAREPGRK